MSLWNLGLSALGAGVTVLTGRQAAEIAKHTFEIHQVMELHERLGFITLSLAIVILSVRLWKKDQLTNSWRWSTIVVLGVLVSVLSYGAHLGGRLVYEFGVGGTFGVSELVTIPSPQEHEHQH